MGSVARFAVVLLGLLMCGCGALDAGSDGDEGYLLRSEEEGASVGVMYVRYNPAGPTGDIAGYMYLTYPGERPAGAYADTSKITGSVDGPSIVVQIEGDPQVEYVGTVEGDTMELRRGLVEWTGEAATYEDFGNAMAEMEEAAREGNFVD